MELFDKKFVHFMWDDSLEGKKGFFADSMSVLQTKVNATEAETPVSAMQSSNEAYPFFTSIGSNDFIYKFFYCDPNYDCKRAYNEGKQLQVKTASGEWLDVYTPDWSKQFEYRIKPEIAYVIIERTPPVSLCCTESPQFYPHVYFTGTKEQCSEYIQSHKKFAEVMQAWEDGKQIQLYSHMDDIWLDCEKPNWMDDSEYRIKPERMVYRQLAEWLSKGNGQYKHCEDVRTYVGYGYCSMEDNKELPDDYKIRRWGSDEWIEPTEQIYLEDCVAYSPYGPKDV